MFWRVGRGAPCKSCPTLSSVALKKMSLYDTCGRRMLGVPKFGVLAPGVWPPLDTGHDCRLMDDGQGSTACFFADDNHSDSVWLSFYDIFILLLLLLRYRPSTDNSSSVLTRTEVGYIV